MSDIVFVYFLFFHEIFICWYFANYFFFIANIFFLVFFIFFSWLIYIYRFFCCSLLREIFFTEFIFGQNSFLWNLFLANYFLLNYFFLFFLIEILFVVFFRVFFLTEFFLRFLQKFWHFVFVLMENSKFYFNSIRSVSTLTKYYI